MCSLMRFQSEDEWFTECGMEFEPSAREAIINCGNLLITAGPGAGKTEILAQKASFLLRTSRCTYPQRILAISFKKDAASNIAERVKQRCGEELARRFHSMTFDAFAKDLMDRYLKAIPEYFRPERSYSIVVKGEELKKRLSACGRPSNDRIKELTAKPLYSLSEYDRSILRDWRILLKHPGEESLLNFRMISRLAELIIKTNPIIKSYLNTSFSHVFLDEFQDTTFIQYDLLKVCFMESKCECTAVGDDKQRIMTWAGARPGIFGEFTRDFNANEVSLLMNYRSAPKLVEFQRHVFKLLGEGALSTLPDKRRESGDGDLTLLHFADKVSEASYLAKLIKGLIDAGTPPRHIAILIRNYIDDNASEVINQLGELGIGARNETQYQNMSSEELVSIIMSVIRLAVIDHSPDDWIHLVEIVIQLKNYSDLEKIHQAKSDLSRLVNDIKNDLEGSTNKKELRSIIDKILEFFSVDSLRAAFPRYSNVDYVESLKDDLSELLWTNRKEEDNWKSALKRFEGDNTIPIMTVHKCKGLEFETVIFLGLEDRLFFNFDRDSDEEIRVFLVAVSRAIKNLVFSTCNSRGKVIDCFLDVITDSGLVKCLF